MLDVTLLGTGGMVPLPRRYLSSLMVRYQGTAVLIDCGEGTQVAIRSAGLGFKQIDTILLTHFHADHITGLPGLLLTIGNSGRTEPILIAGPRYVGRIVDCLRVVAAQLPFEVRYLEVSEGEPFHQMGFLGISACPVEHWVPCYAYRFDLARQPKFDAESARALSIPVKFWSILQNGEAVTVDGKIYSPDQVTGEARKGLRLTYSTDLRPSPKLVEFAKNSDLFVCEGMYGDPELLDKAIEHRHCLFTEAASMAKKACVKELWLTHHSPSMPDPEAYLHHAAAIYPNVKIGERNAALRFSGG